MVKNHEYTVALTWTGNEGQGTSTYRSYSRAHTINGIEKEIVIPGSSDPAFRGDATRYNPEEMLLASLASCHMLWFLHLCTVAGVVVTAYSDEPQGTMLETEDGSGRFEEVVLRPRVTVSNQEMIEQVDDIHAQANKYCFIANSVNFPVKHEGMVEV